ncbi:LacI family DNA-binding transcriptional regulator [Salinibacterium amurskyense]|uniref:LacI family DNA-binding transcriptional regulator n=1 Tax=Salinibacterium amurskyense TaxID=205941 RepID=UPI00311DDD59
MKDVADRAGVAMSSVSRVLSDHPDVSDRMREKVLAAVEELGYEPDVLAQSLRTGATRTIGVLVADISNQLFAEISHGAETVLRAQGYSTFVANSLNDPEIAVKQLRMLIKRRVDGLLISVGEEDGGPIVDAIANSGLPTVLIDRHLGTAGASRVLSDHRAGMTEVVQKLIGVGHRRIALINGIPNVLPAMERAAAAREAAEAHPEVTIEVLSGAFSSEHGEEATRALVASPHRPTAIVAGSNQILIGVLAALRDAGFSAPADLSLVTCDPVPLAEFMTPALDTIWRDRQQLGAEAAGLMLEGLQGASPREVLLPTEYRAGGCVAAPPA